MNLGNNLIAGFTNGMFFTYLKVFKYCTTFLGDVNDETNSSTFL